MDGSTDASSGRPAGSRRAGIVKFAGAAEDFNEDEALLVDPNHPEEIADALSKAANLPLEERVKRWRSMLDEVESYTIHDCRRTTSASWTKAASLFRLISSTISVSAGPTRLKCPCTKLCRSADGL